MNKEKDVVNVMEESEPESNKNKNLQSPEKKESENNAQRGSHNTTNIVQSKSETYTEVSKIKKKEGSILKITQIANENLDEFDYIVKIILVGESAVGKTNICKRYSKNEFDPNSLSTISFELIEKIIVVENERVKACIWDTIGQERFSSISNQYYRATNGALFIFDLSNRESFEKINKWIENYNNYGEKSNIVKFLVGNKSDLKNVKVSKEEILLKSKAYEFDGYFETSALNGSNVNEMFQKLIQMIYDRILKGKKADDIVTTSFALGADSKANKPKSGCSC